MTIIVINGLKCTLSDNLIVYLSLKIIRFKDATNNNELFVLPHLQLVGCTCLHINELAFHKCSGVYSWRSTGHSSHASSLLHTHVNHLSELIYSLGNI